MSLATFFACSWVMPCLSATRDLALLAGLPRLAGVERLERHAALDQLVLEHVEHGLHPVLGVGARSRCRACPPRSPDRRPVFLKSKRCEISLAAWLRALSTSWRSTLLTMSNDGRLRPLGAPCSGAVARAVPDPAGCPSGQRERTVNPSAQPTLVRIQHLPRAPAERGDRRRAGRAESPRWARVSSTAAVAPLAQSAERLHGKEKVYGSIPYGALGAAHAQAG